jgi:hypothetical protein
MFVDIINEPMRYKNSEQDDEHHDADEQDSGSVISPFEGDHVLFANHFSNGSNL